ncbi:MAG: enterochelin esterase-like enzyme [Urechidicola sp.]
MEFFLLFSEIVLSQDSIYKTGPDSQLQSGVPKGVVTKYEWESEIYRNTTFREYYIYVPAQYDSTKPIALMVFQDGHAYVAVDFRVLIVYDNLIHQKKLPITICLFVNPGHDSKEYPTVRWRASNRSEEYDELNDKYVTMLLDEIIPELKKKYNISNDRKMHGIGGMPSSAILPESLVWLWSDLDNK